MLLKLPSMLWSNAPEFFLLCSIYAPHVKHYALQFNVLFLLLENMSISSHSSSSTVQHAITISSLYVYEHFEFIFVAFATLVNT